MIYPAKTPRKRRETPEADLQRALVKVLRMVLAQPFRISSTRNEVGRGGKDGKIAQGIALGMGILPGFADLTVMQGGRHFYLELKAKDGVLSPEQADFRDFCLAEGHPWMEARSIDEALAGLESFGCKTRIKGHGTF